MSKHFDKIGNDELYSRQISSVKHGQDVEMKECQTLSTKIDSAEIDFVQNSVSPELMQEAVQMERLVLSIEQNSLRVSHTLNDVSRHMSSLSKPSGGNDDLKEIEQEMADVEVLSEEETKLMENAFKNDMMKKASKMQGIFTKVQSNYDHVVGSLQDMKIVQSEEPDMRREKQEDSEKEKQMMLNPLQIKITKLKDEVELCQSKARSSEIQRVADKAKFEKIIADYEAETQILLSKVAVAQSSKRFKEQVGRDESNAIGAVSIYEFEELRKETQLLEVELAKTTAESRDKDLSLAVMQNELETAKFDLQSSQDIRSKLQKVNNEMSKKETHFAERLAEAVQKQEDKNLSLENEMEKIMSELSIKEREHDSTKEELEDLKAEAEKSLNEMRRLKGEVNSAREAAAQANQSAEKFQNRLQEVEAEFVASKQQMLRQKAELEEAVLANQKADERAEERHAQLVAEVAAQKMAAQAAAVAEQKAAAQIKELKGALAAEKAKGKQPTEQVSEKVFEKVSDKIPEKVEPEATEHAPPATPPLEEIIPSSSGDSSGSGSGSGGNDAPDDGSQAAVIASLNKTISSLQDELRDLPVRLNRDFQEKLQEQLEVEQKKQRRLQSHVGLLQSQLDAAEQEAMSHYPEILDTPVSSRRASVQTEFISVAEKGVDEEKSELREERNEMQEKKVEKGHVDEEKVGVEKDDASATQTPPLSSTTSSSSSAMPSTILPSKTPDMTPRFTPRITPRGIILTTAPTTTTGCQTDPISDPEETTSTAHLSSPLVASASVILSAPATKRHFATTAIQTDPMEEKRKSVIKTPSVSPRITEITNKTPRTSATKKKTPSKKKRNSHDKEHDHHLETPVSSTHGTTKVVKKKSIAKGQRKSRHVVPTKIGSTDSVEEGQLSLSAQSSARPSLVTVTSSEVSKNPSREEGEMLISPTADTKPSTLLNQESFMSVADSSEEEEEEEEDEDEEEQYHFTQDDVNNAVTVALKDIIASNSGIMEQVADKDTFIGDLFKLYSGHLYANDKCTMPATDVEDLQREVNKVVGVMRGSLSKFLVHEDRSGGGISLLDDGEEEETSTEAMKEKFINKLRVMQLELDNAIVSKNDVEVNLTYKEKLIKDADAKIKKLQDADRIWKDKCDEALDKIHKLILAEMAQTERYETEKAEWERSIAELQKAEAEWKKSDLEKKRVAVSSEVSGGNLLLDKQQKLERQQSVAAMIIEKAEAKEKASSNGTGASDEARKPATGGGFNNLKFLRTMALVKVASTKLKKGRASELMNKAKGVSIVRNPDDISEEVSDEEEEAPDMEKLEKAALLKERQNVLRAVKGDLVATLGEIKSKHFEKLLIGKYGEDDIVFLTRFQFFINSIECDTDNKNTPNTRDAFHTKSLTAKKKAGKALVMGPELQKRAANLELKAQQKLILKKYSLETIAKYLHETEKDLLLHSSFSAWQKLERFNKDGNFIDCLSQHRSSLKQLIEMAGGYKTALREIKMKRDFMADTSFWEEYFRVTVLEYCREELFLDVKEQKKHQEKLRLQIKDMERQLDEAREDSKAQMSWSLKQIASMSKQLCKKIKLPPGVFSADVQQELDRVMRSEKTMNNLIHHPSHSEEDNDEDNDEDVNINDYKASSERETRDELDELERDETLEPLPVTMPSSAAGGESKAKRVKRVSYSEDVIGGESSRGGGGGGNETRFESPDRSQRRQHQDEDFLDKNSDSLPQGFISPIQSRASSREASRPTSSQDSTSTTSQSPPFSPEGTTKASRKRRISQDEVNMSRGSTPPLSREGRISSRNSSPDKQQQQPQQQRPLSKERLTSFEPQLLNSHDSAESDEGGGMKGRNRSSPTRQTVRLTNVPVDAIKKSVAAKKAKSRASTMEKKSAIDTILDSSLTDDEEFKALLRSTPTKEDKFNALVQSQQEKHNAPTNNLPNRVNLELNHLAISLFRKKRAGVPLAQALLPIFANFKHREDRIAGLTKCLPLCRAGTEDAACIRGLREVAEAEDPYVASVEIDYHSAVLSDALAFCLDVQGENGGMMSKEALQEKQKLFFFCDQCSEQNFPYKKFGMMKRAKSFVEAVEDPNDIEVESDEEDNQVAVRIKTVYMSHDQLDDEGENGVGIPRRRIKMMDTHSCQTEPIHVPQDEHQEIEDGDIEHDLHTVCAEVVKSSALRIQEEDNDHGDLLVYVQIRQVENDFAVKTAEIDGNDLIECAEEDVTNISRVESIDGGPGSPLRQGSSQGSRHGSRHGTSPERLRRLSVTDNMSPKNSRGGSRSRAKRNSGSPGGERLSNDEDEDDNEAVNTRENTSRLDSDFENVGVELSPGVRMFSNVVTTICPKDGTERVLKLPPNVVLVKKRKKTTPLFKGIIAWSKWDEMDIEDAPVFPPDVMAVEIPPILDLNKNVHLLCDCSLPYSLDIPKDTWVVTIRREHSSISAADLYPLLPKEFMPVTLSPTVTVSSDLMERLEPHKFLVEAIPHDVMMIQNRYAMMPIGFMFSAGVTLAASRCLPPKQAAVAEGGVLGALDDNIGGSHDATDIDSVIPSDYDTSNEDKKDDEKEKKEGEAEEEIEYVPLILPPGIFVVNIENGCELPSYLRLLKLEDSSVQVGIEEERHECRLEAETIMYSQSITVLECPAGIKLLPGMLLIKRPLSMQGNPLPLPPTMSLCPPNLIPKKLKLKNNIEVVQLCPLFSFPNKIKLCKGVEIFETPAGIVLEPEMVLIRRYAGAPLPPYCRSGVIPYYSEDIFLPPDIEAMYLPHGSRLPLGTELMPKVTVVELPHFDMTLLQPGVYLIHREGGEKLRSHPLPVGFMAAPLRFLPPDLILPPDIEMVYFRPQYALPAGVNIIPGASLSRDIQLPPGLEILPNVEVVKWPYGVYLPSNFECVKKVNKSVKFPPDIIIVDENIKELTMDKNAKNVAPTHCCFIRLPNKVTLPCAAELTEQCILTPIPSWIEFDVNTGFRFPKDVVAIRRTNPTVFNTKHRLNQKPFSILPAQFIQQSKTILPPDLQHTLPADIMLVKVFSHFHIPEGVEIAPNVYADVHAHAPSIPRELVVVKVKKEMATSNVIAKSKGVQQYPSSSLVIEEDYCGYWYHNDLHNIVSWGVGFEKFRPIHYPCLPQGFFLLNQLIHVADERELPGFLELVPVEKESEVCAGLRLPPGTRIAKMLPIQTLPFGLVVDSFEAFPSSPCVQFCPGDMTGTFDREFYPSPIRRIEDDADDFLPPKNRVNTLISARMTALLAQKPSSKRPKTAVANTFQEDYFVLSANFLRTLSHRIIEQLLITRLHTLDRGKNFGYINATIQPPSDDFSLMMVQTAPTEDSFSSQKDLFSHTSSNSRPNSRQRKLGDLKPFSRQLPPPTHPFVREIKTGRPLNRQLSRSITKIFKKVEDNKNHLITEQLLEANQRDLEKAMNKLESVEEELEGALKKNRQMKRVNDTQAREIAAAQKKIERMTSHTASLHEEMHTARDERNKAQAQLTLEGTVASAKVESLTAEKRNLTYIVAEKGDMIEALQEQIQFMKDNNGTSKLQAVENQRRQQVAVNSAVAEYRKLLKIGASSAFDAVRAVRDFCCEDNQMFSNMKFPHALSHVTVGGDDDMLSVLTDDDDNNSTYMLDDSLSINSLTKYSKSTGAPPMGSSVSLTGLSVNNNNSFLPDLHDSGLSTRSLTRAKTAAGDYSKRKNGARRGGGGDTRGHIGRQHKTTIDTMKKEKRQLRQNASEIVIDESHLYSISALDGDSVDEHPPARSRTKGPKKNAACDLSVSSLQHSTGQSSVSKQQQQLRQQSRNAAPSLAGLELLDAPVRNSAVLEVSLAPIDIDTYLDALDTAFVFQETVVDTSKMSQKDLELLKYTKQGVYVLNEETAKQIAANWLQKAMDILSACLGSSLKTYSTAVLLLEKEIGCHISDKRRLNHRIEHLEDKYKDAVSKTETAHESLQSFRIEEMRQKLQESTTHFENMRRISTEPLLKVLSEQTKLIHDLEDQEKRLQMSALAIDKKVAAEALQMKKAPIDDDKKRKAQTKFIEWLIKRAGEIRTRADGLQVQIKDISASVRSEFEEFEGAIQNIIPTSMMMKVLSYGVMLTSNKCPPVLAEDNLSSTQQEMKLLASSGLLANKNYMDVKKPGKMLTAEDFMNEPDDVNVSKSNTSSASSTSEKKKPPLLPIVTSDFTRKKKDTTTSNDALPSHRDSQRSTSRASSKGDNKSSRDKKEATSTSASASADVTPKGSARSNSSRPGSKQGLADLKADPFNRSFTDL